jgi:hypothetical protein
MVYLLIYYFHSFLEKGQLKKDVREDLQHEVGPREP